jgi:hypothetical protein
VKKNPSMN